MYAGIVERLVGTSYVGHGIETTIEANGKFSLLAIVPKQQFAWKLRKQIHCF
jgi:hypothetical protein